MDHYVMVVSYIEQFILNFKMFMTIQGVVQHKNIE